MGIRKVVIFLLIILSMISFGESNAETDEMMDYGLMLSPEKCLLKNDAIECDIIVKINWRTKLKDDYCLYNNLSRLAITCWNETKHAEKEVLLSISQDLTFELRHKKTNEMIFSSILKIYKKKTNSRRKRRNPWSFY